VADRDARNVTPRLDSLEAIRRAVIERTSELQELIESLSTEHELLTRTLGALNGYGTAAREPQPRAPGAATRPATNGHVRPSGRRTETRADQALRLLGSQPGMTSGALARAMGISPQYVYRVVGKLGRDGRIVKTGVAYTLAGDGSG
jgi:Winged helix-turn-helix DNA-binding